MIWLKTFCQRYQDKIYSGQEKKAVLPLLRLHGLCGERKALWGNAPMCLERWLVLSALAFNKCHAESAEITEII